jgi:GTP cyclohydrolase FolE2
MKDIQNHKDNRNIGLDQVGVKGIHYPIIFVRRNRRHTVVCRGLKARHQQRYWAKRHF